MHDQFDSFAIKKTMQQRCTVRRNAFRLLIAVSLIQSQCSGFTPSKVSQDRPTRSALQQNARLTFTETPKSVLEHHTRIRRSTAIFSSSTNNGGGFQTASRTSTSDSSHKSAAPLFAASSMLLDQAENAGTIDLSAKAASSSSPSSILDNLLEGYLGPRLVLAAVACLYATNFPLGAMMNDALPASAATSARMVFASLALSPFLFQIQPNLRLPAILGGCFTSLGYISQSIALVDTSPATVSFLGSATVLVCPALEYFIDKKPMSLKEAPQTWLAAALCLLGVGVLELFDPAGGGLSATIGMGDALALIQAVGFGTGVYMSEKMMKDHPSQALPVTATLVATTALISCLWCLCDGWMFQPGYEMYTLPNLFFEPSLQNVAAAVAWTGIVSTSFNFFVEISALGKVPPAEASVILATEPLWAALFASLMFRENFGSNDVVGGFLIVMACLANTLKPSDFYRLVGFDNKEITSK